MVLRIALFVLMAVGLLGFGAVAWFSAMPPPTPEIKVAEVAPTAPPPPPPPKVSVVVAAHQLRAGTFLKADDVRAEAILGSEVPPGAVADRSDIRAKLQGAMLRHSVVEGQALLASDVLSPGDHGFLAAVLEPGMSAVTLGVNEIASDWGLLWPGDHIDLILTQSFDAADTLARRHIAAETVLTNLRVVAVDQQLVQGEMADDAEHKATARTLTVEVSSVQAERLAIALRLGKLSISLRSATTVPDGKSDASPDAPVFPRVMWSGDVAQALGQRTRAPTPATVLLFRGNAGGESHS
jgi:pilus assembly protein CpaB